jgi:hypothetical protein
MRETTMETAKKVRIGTAITEELAELLRKCSEGMGISQSSVVRHGILEMYLRFKSGKVVKDYDKEILVYIKELDTVYPAMYAEDITCVEENNNRILSRREINNWYRNSY